jgi:hypothetical protein
MRITIKPRAMNCLEEQERSVAHIYQCNCRIKLRKDADRELLKTDIRAIKGVTIVTTIPQSEKAAGEFSYQIISIKFQPYDTAPIEFIRNLSNGFRKLTLRGLVSFHFQPESLHKIKV